MVARVLFPVLTCGATRSHHHHRATIKALFNFDAPRLRIHQRDCLILLALCDEPENAFRPWLHYRPMSLRTKRTEASASAATATASTPSVSPSGRPSTTAVPYPQNPTTPTPLPRPLTPHP